MPFKCNCGKFFKDYTKIYYTCECGLEWEKYKYDKWRIQNEQTNRQTLCKK